MNAVSRPLYCCGGTTGIDCSTLCACEIPQATDGALKACQYDESTVPLDPEIQSPNGQPVSGWCYVSPEQGFGAEALVNQCPAGMRQNLRLLGSAISAPDEHLFAICGESCSEMR